MIFKGQSSLRIQLTTNVDITGALVKSIKYIKPSGATGSWTATSADDLLGIIYYDIQAGDLSESGNWKMWAFITFADGRSAPGEAIKIPVKKEGVC